MFFTNPAAAMANLRRATRPGGRLLIPLGPRDAQVLTLVTKGADGVLERKNVIDAIFVPLLGKHGFHAQ